MISKKILNIREWSELLELLKHPRDESEFIKYESLDDWSAHEKNGVLNFTNKNNLLLFPVSNKKNGYDAMIWSKTDGLILFEAKLRHKASLSQLINEANKTIVTRSGAKETEVTAVRNHINDAHNKFTLSVDTEMEEHDISDFYNKNKMIKELDDILEQMATKKHLDIPNDKKIVWLGVWGKVQIKRFLDEYDTRLDEFKDYVVLHYEG